MVAVYVRLQRLTSGILFLVKREGGFIGEIRIRIVCDLEIIQIKAEWYWRYSRTTLIRAFWDWRVLKTYKLLISLYIPKVLMNRKLKKKKKYIYSFYDLC